MRRRTIWLVCIILLILVLVYQSVFHPVSSSGNSIPSSSIVAIDAVGNAVTFLLLGGVASLISSVFPYQSWSYKAKVQAIFPVVLLVILLIFAVTVGILDYHEHFNSTTVGPVR